MRVVEILHEVGQNGKFGEDLNHSERGDELVVNRVSSDP